MDGYLDVKIILISSYLYAHSYIFKQMTTCMHTHFLYLFLTHTHTHTHTHTSLAGIKTMILCGNIDGAMATLREQYPGLLEAHSDLRLQLLGQRFVELIGSCAGVFTSFCFPPITSAMSSHPFLYSLNAKLIFLLLCSFRLCRRNHERLAAHRGSRMRP